MESFVSINIYKSSNINDRTTNELYNDNGVPLLYYCNDSTTLNDQLLNNNKFREFLNKHCFLLDIYENSFISYFYFKPDLEDDGYTQITLSLQEFIPLELMNDNERIFYKSYLQKIFENLYINTFKKHYYADIMFDTDGIIKDIYSKIITKYKDKLTKLTIINFVRSELQKMNLKTNNIIYIINSLENILKDVE
jgi:hypothetical protein